MSIEAKQQTIAQVFDGDQQYLVPDYQRPYVWTFDNAYQLVDDLKSAWRRNDESYFLGSVVLVNKRETSTFDVIDGQQRMTTLMLLFAVLRHYAENAGRKAELTDLLMTKANSIRSVSARPRVQVRNVDREFFRGHIIGDDIDGLREMRAEDLATESQRNLRRNVQAIIEGLDDVFDSAEPWKFVQFVVTRVSLVVVTTDGFESAHRIFSVLNTRGVPLTASDIFKARVLGEIDQDDREPYARLWDQSLAPLGDNPDSFFQQLLILTTRSNVKHGLMEEFTDRVLDHYMKEHSGASFIDNVVSVNAEAYCKVSTYGKGASPALEQQLNLLRQYPSDEWKSVAMWTLTSPFGEAERSRILSGLERVFGVYTTAGVSADIRGNRVIQILKDLEEFSGRTTHRTNTLEEAFRISDDIKQRAVLRLKGQLPRSGLRKILLLRAHYASVGDITGMPRRLAVAQFVTAKIAVGVQGNLDVELWRGRLGSMCLVNGKVTRFEQADSWDQFRAMIRPEANTVLSPVVDVSAMPTITHGELMDRQNELVKLIAGFWDIERDSDGVYLPTLDEEQLIRSTSGRHMPRSRRIRLVDVIRTGILDPGDVLVWDRVGKGEEYRASVTPNGELQLADGATVSSPSAASAAVSGTSTRALDVWKRSTDGKSLRDMWQIYEKRFYK